MAIIGIDLGTTNSLAAHLGERGPYILRNGLGDEMTASAVAIGEDDAVLVGRAALEVAARDPTRAATLFKRDMGVDRRRTVHKKKFSPQELSGLVLKSLREDAEQALGFDVTDAVITVPAYFNDAQRQATKDAGEIAGLNVRRILNEPTAAAMAYGLHHDPTERNVLVFDLGGGTFDVSIVECADGVLQVKASAGEAFLGGEDFTLSLMECALAKADLTLGQLQSKSPALLGMLRHKAESAKCALSTEESVEIAIPDPERKEWTKLRDVTIDRVAFADAVAPLVERLGGPTWRALRDSRLKPGDISEVLLVGGATRMPLVQDWVRSFFAKEPRCSLDPDTVVALGAAVQAGLVVDDAAVSDIVVTDVMPHTLGVEVAKQLSARLRDGYFMPIIERNTTIPVSRIEQMSTVVPGQKQIRLKVYQGESPRAEENLLLGELNVKGIPSAPAGRETIAVRFTYDLNGLLEVEATVESTGKVERLIIEARPGRLSESEKKKALDAMQKLKVNQRDRSRNRLVLEQAKRLWTELTGFQREQLSEAMDAFEAALESQDPEFIDRARFELEIALSYLSGELEGGEGGEAE